MQPSSNTVLFIPRPEYHVIQLELPLLSKKEREKAGLNKLGGKFPGRLDDKYIVFHPNNKRGNYLALVFNNVLRGDPLSISTLAASKLCKKGLRYCVIACDNWIEYLTLDDGIVESSMVCLSDGQLSDQLAAQAAQWFGLAEKSQTEKPVIEVFCASSQCPAKGITETAAAAIRFSILEKALASYPRSKWSCFPGRLPQIKRRNRLLVVLFCIAVGIMAYFIYDFYKQKEAELSIRRQAEQELVLKNAEQKSREQRLALLKTAWDEQLAEQRVGVYKTMETLASCLSPAIRLFSTTIKESGDFRLEGNSANVIAALEALQSHPNVQNAVIGTIVWERGIERFTVNGKVEQQPALPEEYLTDEEKITWYETSITNSIKNITMPETSAVASGNIKNLLERHKLSITRFRYLNSHDNRGWEIECAVSGSGIRIIEALKEADMTDSLRVTSLETRNRQDGIDAVITFFVYGPGEEQRRRTYEDHPSLAKIAALYGLPPVAAVQPAKIQPQPVITTPRQQPSIPVTASFSGSLEYIGLIETDGKRNNIFVKETNSGELYRLTEGSGNYSYNINGDGKIIAYLIESLGPIEVRRNDGF